MTMLPAQHECHAGCLIRAEVQALQLVVGNTCGVCVERVAESQGR